VTVTTWVVRLVDGVMAIWGPPGEEAPTGEGLEPNAAQAAARTAANTNANHFIPLGERRIFVTLRSVPRSLILGKANCQVIVVSRPVTEAVVYAAELTGCFLSVQLGDRRLHIGPDSSEPI
jgi:hypothetical protein